MERTCSLAGGDERPNGNDDVIFSYIDGHVWMSWPGHQGRVRVGNYEVATASMRDFLAQCDLGERLASANA
jgi:hypothetical protein